MAYKEKIQSRYDDVIYDEIKAEMGRENHVISGSDAHTRKSQLPLNVHEVYHRNGCTVTLIREGSRPNVAENIRIEIISSDKNALRDCSRTLSKILKDS